MRILSFDSALGPVSAAILERDCVLAQGANEDPSRAAEALIPVIEDCLAQAKLRIADLDRLVVTVGPGRFTSLRVGLAAAHGFLLAHPLPIVGIDSFEALATSLPAGSAPIVVGIDAGRGDIAARRFDGPDDHILLGPPQDLLGRLPPMPWRFAGTGFESLGAQPIVTRIDPVALARLGARRPPSARIDPRYLRAPAVDAARALLAEELEAAEGLHARCFSQAWDLATLRQFLADPTVRGLVVGALGDLKGFMLFRLAADEAEILTLCVDPAERGRGHGYRLLQAMRAAARQAGVRRTFLEVAEDNDRAIALYKKAGFAIAGRRKLYYHRPSGADIDALVLRSSDD